MAYIGGQLHSTRLVTSSTLFELGWEEAVSRGMHHDALRDGIAGMQRRPSDHTRKEMEGACKHFAYLR